MVLVTQTVTDIQNGVGLVGTIGSEEGIEAGICLDVDKHAGGASPAYLYTSASAISANYKKHC